MLSLTNTAPTRRFLPVGSVTLLPRSSLTATAQYAHATSRASLSIRFPHSRVCRNQPAATARWFPSTFKTLSIAEDPWRLTAKDALRAIEALRMIHDAGVLHGDSETSNSLLSKAGERVWWVDFDSAVTKARAGIDDRWFEMEMRCTSETLLDDVVSSTRRRGSRGRFRLIGGEKGRGGVEPSASDDLRCYPILVLAIMYL
ncbi:hypothetical protein BDD12DRAFT_829280 [Trichophaea hybrida]|nr:hypothetical protein BDD12DRAFT_829280 [Trichophaea hybrida]